MRNEIKGRAKGEGRRHRHQNVQFTEDREYHGVAIVLNPIAKLCMTDFEQVDGRVMSVSLYSAGPPIYFINAYAPQSGVNTQQKEAFYDVLERQLNKFPGAHVKYYLGDFNARLYTRYEHESMLGPNIFGRGRHYLRHVSDEVMENRRLFLNFYTDNNLFVINTWFQKTPKHQLIFREPAIYHEPPWDASRFTQLDFVLAPARWKNSVQDVTARTQIFIDYRVKL